MLTCSTTEMWYSPTPTSPRTTAWSASGATSHYILSEESELKLILTVNPSILGNGSYINHYLIQFNSICMWNSIRPQKGIFYFYLLQVSINYTTPNDDRGKRPPPPSGICSHVQQLRCDILRHQLLQERRREVHLVLPITTFSQKNLNKHVFKFNCGPVSSGEWQIHLFYLLYS